MKLMKGMAAFASRIAVVAAFIVPLAGCWNNSRGDHDVDLASAVWLSAEPVPTVVDNEGVPPESGGITTPVANLFTLQPGTKVNVSALSATIDPTGTSIVNDFDGDGILNANETTTNVWVADYPMVETVIATPVTMKIKIAQSTQTTNDEIVSEITSDDYVSNKNEGSEKIHQNELNLKTVQYQDSYSRSDEASNSTSSSMNFGFNASVMQIASIGMNYGISSSNSWSSKHATAETTTKWADKPFKNNLDRDAWSLKSDASAQKARKYRVDRSTKIDSTSRVDANAGYVRAPLYIKNLSVNMPVRLSNILCSLMFETSGGELIPVQSFRLRNEDYSLFEVEVYGGTEFGPYVIELNGLNTAEVENAIAKGYSPKIFIVDYEMTHVADSNYRSMLLNFSGDNLKIVEENAKGRTAQVKIFGPNIREKYRVSAFSTNDSSDPCSVATAATMSPGVSLQEALERIACSGLEVEYEDYVVDLSEVAPTLAEPKVYLRGIKSIGGVQTNFPCTNETRTGTDGITRTACVQKPMDQWTEEETQAAGVWAIYSNGKYYAMTEYWKDGGGIRIFDPGPGNINSPMVKGTDSMIWAGDYYDIVYIRFADFLKKVEQHGSSPLESGVAFKQNTRWDLASMGEHPYDPDKNSRYLGEVGFGERIELKIKLDQTQYLTPDFGTVKSGGTFEYFDGFSYNWKKSTSRYSIDQAADFEISMGFGGDRSDWLHIVKDLDNSDPYLLKSCGRTLDYIAQTFTICVELPTQHASVDPESSLVKLYIRPSLNAAYRRTIWPLNYTEVRKMRGELAIAAADGDVQIQVMNVTGAVAAGDDLFVVGDSTPYTITSVSAPAADGSVTISLGSSLRDDYVRTTAVFIKSGLTSPEMRLAVDSGFYSDWNTDVQNNFVPGAWMTEQPLPMLYNNSVSCSTNPFHPASCLGFNVNVNALNWMGAGNEGVAHWNAGTDGSRFDTFLSGGLLRYTATTGRSYRMEPSVLDFAFSESSGAPGYTAPIILPYQGRALIVWKRDTALRGRWYSLTSGVAEGPELVLTTAPVTGVFAVRSYGDKAVFAWENGNTIYMAGRDLSSGSPITEATVGTRSVVNATGSTRGLDIAVGDDRALVTWIDTAAWSGQGAPIPWVFGCPGPLDQCYYTVYYDRFTVKGRMVDLNTGTFVAAESTLHTATNYIGGSPEYPAMQIAAAGAGNQAAILYQVRNTHLNRNYSVSALSIDLATGAVLGTRTLESVPGSNLTTDMTHFSAIGSNGRAFFSWRSADGTLRGRGMDTTSATLLGSSNIEIATAVDAAFASVTETTGFVSYTKNSQAYLQAIDMDGGFKSHSNGIALSTLIASERRPGGATISGNTILALWMQRDGSGPWTVKGRTINASTYQPIGLGEFMVSTRNEGDQSGPVATGYSGTGHSFWLSQDADQPRIRGLAIDLSNPGSLRFGLNNFFVAPLIERDYTIQARIKY